MQIISIDKIESILSLIETPVYLYGAGVRARQILDIFTNRKVKIYGFVVSSMERNPPSINGMPVIPAANFDENNAEVVFAIDAKDPKKIVHPFISRIFVLSDELFEAELTGIFKKKIAPFLKSIGAYLTDGNVERAHLRAVCDNLVFRIPPSILEKNHLEIMERRIKKNQVSELFEHCYGQFDFVKKHTRNEWPMGKSYSVYMVCSEKDKLSYVHDIPHWIIPIQAGAALADRITCSVRDDTGYNISLRNRDYSECTALYWMWRNAPQTDYIGLCHYRRHFDLNEQEIDILGQQGYDIVATIPTITWSNQRFFSQFVSEKDINLLIEAINKLYPEYIDAAEIYYDNVFFPPCNLFIMKWDVFKDFGEFVFGITDYIYDFYQSRGITRNDRYMGYLVENLTGIFISKNSRELKIGYADMRFLR